MTKLPQFTLNASGELVYSKTGKLAPTGYFAVGNTVYKPASNSVGRLRAGSFKKPANLTQKTRKKIESARTSRVKRKWAAKKREDQRRIKLLEDYELERQARKAAGAEIGAAAATEEHGAPHIPMPGDFTRGGPGILIPDQSYQDQIERMRPLAKRHFLSSQEMSAYNFARWVKGIRESGKMTEDEQIELWRRYAQATAPGERTDIWEATEDAFGEITDYVGGSP